MTELCSSWSIAKWTVRIPKALEMVELLYKAKDLGNIASHGV